MIIGVSIDELKGEGRNVSIDMTDKLSPGELLTGTPTITPDTGLSTFNASVNIEEVTILGRAVAIGKAITFHVEATDASTTVGLYDVHAICSTDSSPVQSLDYDLKLDVE